MDVKFVLGFILVLLAIVVCVICCFAVYQVICDLGQLKPKLDNIVYEYIIGLSAVLLFFVPAVTLAIIVLTVFMVGYRDYVESEIEEIKEVLENIKAEKL